MQAPDFDRPSPRMHGEIIPERVLSDRWHKSIRTLQRWRAERYGPAWLRIGGTIFYRLEDVMAFETKARCGGEDA